MNKVNLKDYVCSIPFINLEVHENQSYLCCPSWLKKHLPVNTKIDSSWNSTDSDEVRKSVIDGSFKYCDKTVCPHLNQLISGTTKNINPIYHKDDLPKSLSKKIQSFESGNTVPPSIIQFSFDRTCNLKCPSCRLNLIVENTDGISRVKNTIDEIEKIYSKDVTMLYITGTGDPFVSVGFRDFLRNFDESKWPSLKQIHLHTNATKWNKKMWDSMSRIHKYVKTCEISIDAGNKFTYENVTRIGGDWDELLENLKFISTIPTLKNIKTSFVVQTHNYKEMKSFYDLMTSIFGNRVNVFYGKIINWGTFTEEEFLNHKIWDTEHPLYNDFVNEINSFILKEKIRHNLQEFVNPIKKLI